MILPQKGVQQRVEVRRGDVFYTTLPYEGCGVQCGRRPVVVIQNDVGNRNSPTVLVAPLTAKLKKLDQPTHVVFNCFGRASVVLCEQIMTLRKEQLEERLGSIPRREMPKIENALAASFGFLHRLQIA